MTAVNRPSVGMRAPIPVTIFTGFLGAGKTTLLNRLLKDADLADTAVIINEFGEIGLDHLLVERADDSVVELSSGCLCCTIRGDLISTLEDLLRRLDNGRLDHLARVVIETTGLADPAPVLHAVMLHPYLVQRYRLDGVITVIDAINGLDTLDAHEEAVKQAAVADRLVLAKSDLVQDEPRCDALTLLRDRLRVLNPGAILLDAAKGEARAAALTNTGLFDPTTKIPDVARWLNEEAYRDPHLHHRHHDVNRHDARVRAFTLAAERPVPEAALDMFLDLMRSAHGPKLLRVKGIVATVEDSEHPVVLHGVQHVLHPPVKLENWPDDDRRTRLVFITRDLPEGFVRRLFDAFTGTVAPDTPDRKAVENNPLAISGFSGRFD